MFAKKKDTKKKATPKKKNSAKLKLEQALEEMKQLSLEAEDFFTSIKESDQKDKENGRD